MDSAALTTMVMGMLETFFAGVGGAVATHVGNAVFEQSKRAYEAVRTRFAKEADKDGGKASRALQESASDPDFASVVEKKLLSLLQSDATFAETLHHIVQTGPRQSLSVEEEAQARRIRMTNNLGTGEQDIRGGKRATIEDIHLSIG